MGLKRMTAKTYDAESIRARLARRFTALLAVAILGAATMGTAHAVGFDNSLWLGNDTGFQPVVNTDTSGTVLRTLSGIGATGFAIDLATSTIYIAEGGNFISQRDLGTLAETRSAAVAGVRFFEDMTFDGSSIWAADFYGPDLLQGVIVQIDPVTLTVTSSFTPAGILRPVGIAWDGSGLWVSGCTTDAFCPGGSGATNLVARYSTSGTPTGPSFMLTGDIGGLAFDPRDNTLWIGGQGLVRHFTTGGTLLGSFATTETGRFVDGLEFQGTPLTPVVRLEIGKLWSQANVCFERDNDGDGKVSEDPIDFDASGAAIDNDRDGRFNEDPSECPAGTSLGTPLATDADGNYQVQAVLNKSGTVTSYNPGQVYAVSTVKPLSDVSTLVITEDYSDCTTGTPPLLSLNPAPGSGGGSVVVVIPNADGIPVQVLDANSPGVVVSATDATIRLKDVVKDTTIMVYVKFAPSQQGQTFAADSCKNVNSALAEDAAGAPVSDLVEATAVLEVTAKR